MNQFYIFDLAINTTLSFNMCIPCLLETFQEHVHILLSVLLLVTVRSGKMPNKAKWQHFVVYSADEPEAELQTNLPNLCSKKSLQRQYFPFLRPHAAIWWVVCVNWTSWQKPFLPVMVKVHSLLTKLLVSFHEGNTSLICLPNQFGVTIGLDAGVTPELE